ncbi:MAG: hypothetical protein IPN00_09100 [Hydrogenophilales bacterium]|jgi:hypothetical protein|nr:hypothetical protein [Hydrogenophilales bacterium]
MYTEQLAILLFLAANGLASQGPINQGHMDQAHMARMPRGGAERVGLSLKLDPRLQRFRNLQAGKVARNKRQDPTVLFASLD